MPFADRAKYLQYKHNWNYLQTYKKNNPISAEEYSWFLHATNCGVCYTPLKNKKIIEVWGDGKQTRSFMYIDDCINGMLKIFYSKYSDPINLGSSERVSINQMISIIEKIASIKVKKKYLINKPKGVRGRSSDNKLIKKVIK